jgi:inhibitor of KinA
MPKGYLIEWDEDISKQLTAKLQALRSYILGGYLRPHLEEIVLGYNSLYLRFKSNNNLPAPGSISEEINRFDFNEGRIIPHKFTIPVCYHPEICPDLDDICTQLHISVEQLIGMHTADEYYVSMLGFLPGFIYLGGMNPQMTLDRKSTPTPNIQPGSIAIGGQQTGIYSLSSPGGWHVIGRTPQRFFDIDQNPPMKVQAGDRILFRPISLNEFYGQNTSQ